MPTRETKQAEGVPGGPHPSLAEDSITLWVGCMGGRRGAMGWAWPYPWWSWGKARWSLLLFVDLLSGIRGRLLQLILTPDFPSERKATAWKWAEARHRHGGSYCSGREQAPWPQLEAAPWGQEGVPVAASQLQPPCGAAWGSSPHRHQWEGPILGCTGFVLSPSPGSQTSQWGDALRAFTK